MTPAEARHVVDQYFASWLDPNLEQFLGCLDISAVVRECTGSVYAGRDEHVAWFTDWNSAGNGVHTWDIHAFGFDAVSESAFVEWYFDCTYGGTRYDWYGASVVRFREGLIVELNEYERKK